MQEQSMYILTNSRSLDIILNRSPAILRENNRMAEMEMDNPVYDASPLMTSPPEARTRRRETYTSLQLQRAADQLQEAIQSARKRRSSTSRATSLSLLLSSDDEDDDDNSIEGMSDQENRPLNLMMTSGVKKDVRREDRSVLEKTKLRSDHNDTQCHNDKLLTLTDLNASPVQKPMASSVATGESSVSPVKAGPMCQSLKLFEDSFVEKQARKALDMVEQEVEDQARANKAAQEELKRIVDSLDTFIAGLMGGDNQVERCPAVVAVDAVRQLGELWNESLSNWKTSILNDKSEVQEKFMCYQQEMQARIKEMQVERNEERARHDMALSTREERQRCLEEKIACLQHKYVEDVNSATLMNEKLMMENEDLRGQLLAADEKRDITLEADGPSAEQQQRHILNLLTQLKQAELRELQWEMLFEEQVHATSQAQERLLMLLEDHKLGEIDSRGNTFTFPKPSDPLTTHPKSLMGSSSAASAELHLYQQRIEFLEDQLRDVQEQINCDHHQFLYEQQKWEYEKKHLGQDVEEVHGVSIKVLKLLLLREKLLKRQEKKMKKRMAKLHADDEMIQAQRASLRELIGTAIEECAVSLLYARQLAMASEESSPVKPVKLVRLLKRLQRLQDDQADGTNSPKRHCSTPSSGASVRDQSE